MCQNTHSISLSCPSPHTSEKRSFEKKKEVYIAAAAAAGCDAPFAAAESFLCWPAFQNEQGSTIFETDQSALSFHFIFMEVVAIQTSISFFFNPPLYAAVIALSMDTFMMESMVLRLFSPLLANSI